MLNNLPSNVHPIAQFSAAITACNSESKCAKAGGIKKSVYWEVQAGMGFSLNELYKDLSIAIYKLQDHNYMYYR